MIKVNIISVGKIKEPAFTLAAREYEKRLSAFCDLSFTEIKPARLPENPSAGEIAAALKTEAAAILPKIPEGAAVYPLCIEGASFSSEGFAAEIKANADAGKPLCFIIGGSHGLDRQVKSRGKGISFSDMTFPHRLFRIMLLEQIYRAFMINAGAKYHK
ncbi:MAG: 23S rRNA (pseudouridine(1915)-N(3))-methyltransferase RlmH [Clostridia bacterium]|nr:23S rRNA (pseudouridine(1915)-N(3))-methyltransferase RlmH [Clostridia bacterium]